MGTDTVRQMTEEVAGLMEQRLGVRGADAADKLQRGRRRLPRKLRGAAALLADAAAMSSNPKLAPRLQSPRLTRAHHALVHHLAPMGRSTRRRGVLRDMASSAAFSLFMVAGLAVAVLAWRGYR